jgi:hypothetical protein
VNETKGGGPELRKPGLLGWTAIALIAVCLIAAAVLVLRKRSEDSKPGPAETVAGRALERWHSGDWEGFWRMLHPATQDAVPLETYVACEESLPAPDAVELEPIGPGSTTIDQDFLPLDVVKTFVYEASPVSGDGEPQREAVPLTLLGGKYQVLLAQDEYEAWTEGTCSDVFKAQQKLGP